LDEGDSEFERVAEADADANANADAIDDDLDVEDCTPMAENQINRTFSTKQFSGLDDRSSKHLIMLDFAPSPNLSPMNCINGGKVKINVSVPVPVLFPVQAAVSENVQEESKDESPDAVNKLIRCTGGIEKKIASRRPTIDINVTPSTDQQTTH
jgi:hypothetical protein